MPSEKHVRAIGVSSELVDFVYLDLIWNKINLFMTEVRSIAVGILDFTLNKPKKKKCTKFTNNIQKLYKIDFE